MSVVMWLCKLEVISIFFRKYRTIWDYKDYTGPYGTIQGYRWIYRTIGIYRTRHDYIGLYITIQD